MNLQVSKDVTKLEEIVGIRPGGRVSRQARKTAEKPQQANSKTKSTDATSNTESDLKPKLSSASTNGLSTPSKDNSSSTKPVQTVNVSVAEEMATIVESNHAESKASDEASDSPAEDSSVSARRGRTRTTRRSAASAATGSPAASKNGLAAAATQAAMASVASPAQPANKASAASVSTAAKSASSAVKGGAGTSGKKDSRPSTPLISDRPKRTRKSLAESREAS